MEQSMFDNVEVLRSAVNAKMDKFELPEDVLSFEREDEQYRQSSDFKSEMKKMKKPLLTVDVDRNGQSFWGQGRCNYGFLQDDLMSNISPHSTTQTSGVEGFQREERKQMKEKLLMIQRQAIKIRHQQFTRRGNTRRRPLVEMKKDLETLTQYCKEANDAVEQLLKEKEARIQALKIQNLDSMRCTEQTLNDEPIEICPFWTPSNSTELSFL